MYWCLTLVILLFTQHSRKSLSWQLNINQILLSHFYHMKETEKWKKYMNKFYNTSSKRKQFKYQGIKISEYTKIKLCWRVELRVDSQRFLRFIELSITKQGQITRKEQWQSELKDYNAVSNIIIREVLKNESCLIYGHRIEQADKRNKINLNATNNYYGAQRSFQTKRRYETTNRYLMRITLCLGD